MDTMRFFSPFYRQRLNAVGSALLCSLAVLTRRFSVGAMSLCVVFVILSATAIFCFDSEMRAISTCFCIGIALALLVSGAFMTRLKTLDAFNGKETSFSGVISAKSGTQTTLRLTSLDQSGAWELCTAKDFPASFSVGECVSGTARFAKTGENQRQNGVFLKIDSVGTLTKTEKCFLLSDLYAGRDRAKNSFPATREGAFWRAILFGDRSGLSFSDQSMFRRLGASHLLAISGLHVSVAIGMVFSLMRLIPLPRKVRDGIMILWIGAVFFLCGESVPVLRAACMATMAQIGCLFSRRSTSVTNLVFAACLVAVINPLALFSPSFLLSFTASGAILTVAVPVSEELHSAFWLRRRQRPILSLCLTMSLFVIDSFLVSSAAVAATFPWQLLLFSEAQAFSALYSLLLVMLFSPVVFCGVISAVLSGVFSVSFPPASALCSAFLWLVETLADSAPAVVSLTRIRALIFGVIFLIILAGIYLFRARRTALYWLYAIETVFGIAVLFLS